MHVMRFDIRHWGSPRRYVAMVFSALWLCVLGSVSSAFAAGPLAGYWMDSHGEVILDIHPCATSPAYCGRVAWLRLPYGPDRKLLTDYRNPDPNLRNRLVCGLEVLTGFTQQEDGKWSDGSVYVSDLGMTFSGHAEVLNPNEVKVTGYVVLPIFGQSEVWTRVTDPVEPCWEAADGLGGKEHPALPPIPQN